MESEPSRQSRREKERRLRLFSSIFLSYAPLSYPISSFFTSFYFYSFSTYLILRLLLLSSSSSFSSFTVAVAATPVSGSLRPAIRAALVLRGYPDVHTWARLSTLTSSPPPACSSFLASRHRHMKFLAVKTVRSSFIAAGQDRAISS